MSRRDKPSSKAAKTQRHGTLSSDKRASISRRRGSAAAVDETGVTQLIRERDEARQQQAANQAVCTNLVCDVCATFPLVQYFATIIVI